jgi:hypothetical protein
LAPQSAVSSAMFFQISNFFVVQGQSPTEGPVESQGLSFCFRV